ncbi:MAG: hypothetical protein DRI54_06490, partial [Bacteroidetes bacterium]
MEEETEQFIESYNIKKRVLTFLKRYEWVLLISLTVISWVLGFIGFWIYFKEIGEVRTLTDIAYVTFQLFTFESGFIDGHAPVVLDIARFLAPFTLVYAAFTAFMWFINQQYKLLRLKKYKDHTIFLGLGKQGIQLLKNLQNTNEKIVVVTREELAPTDKPDHIDTIFITANINDIKVLKKIQLEYAKHVMCMADDEKQNLSTGIFISDYSKLNLPNNKTKIYIQTSPLLIEQLQELDFDDKASGNHNIFEHKVHFFNIYERAARLLIKKYSPDRFAEFPKDSEVQAHILIAGFDAMGQALLLQAGKMFHFANRDKLKATVIHNNIEEVERFIKSYPGVVDVIDLDFIEQNDINKRNIYEKTGNSEIHMIFICVADDMVSVNVFNTLSLLILETNLVFCHEHSGGFSERIDRKNIDHFSVYDETLNIDSIVKENIDKQAMIVHQSYMIKENANTDTKIKDLKKLTHLEWNSLTERTKNANRNQADHIDIKLRAFGCVTKPIEQNEKLYDFTSDMEMVEILAEVEHRRWNAEQLLNGWVYGEMRNNELKIHDNIVPYAELTD